MKISKLYLLLSVLFFSGLYCMEVGENKIKIIVGEEDKDQKEFEVDINVASMSITLKHILEDLPAKDVAIPLATILPEEWKFLYKAMEKLQILGYVPGMEKQKENLEKYNKYKEDLGAYLSDDLINKDINQLVGIGAAASYLDIGMLLDVIVDEFFARFDSGSVSLELLNELLNNDKLLVFADVVKGSITEKIEQYLRITYLKNRDIEFVTIKGYGGWVVSVAFSSNGKTLASGSSDNAIRLWNVDNGSEGFGKEIKILEGHGDMVWSVAFSPDGKTLASGSSDKTIRLWTLFDNKDFEALNNIKNLSIKQMLVLYFLINQNKKNKTLTLDDKAEDVWQGIDKDIQNLVNNL